MANKLISFQNCDYWHFGDQGFGEKTETSLNTQCNRKFEVLRYRTPHNCGHFIRAEEYIAKTRTKHIRDTRGNKR